MVEQLADGVFLGRGTDVNWVLAVDARDSDFAGPVDRLEAGRSSMLTILVSAVAGIAVLGGLLAWWLGHRLTAPLARLRERMTEIADGEGDLTQRVADSSQDEVGELARVVDACYRSAAEQREVSALPSP